MADKSDVLLLLNRRINLYREARDGQQAGRADLTGGDPGDHPRHADTTCMTKEC